MSFLVTVYGVASPDEACRFESEGANVIGVFLGQQASGRAVDEAMASTIAQNLSSAQLCVESLADSEIEPEVALRVGARWVQTPWGPPSPAAWRSRLTESGLGWLLARVPANEDDDPKWVLDRITEYGDPAPTWAQVELCPDLQDGWEVLREPTPDELDIGDLNRIATQTPIVVSLPLTVERLAELSVLLPCMYGVALTLTDENGKIPGATSIDPKDALAIVRTLRNSVA
ncbi:MAG: hypothetical protein ACRDRW_22020 [Pseudonocardiaceae bacterium]